MKNIDDDSISGFAVAGAFLTTGILMLFLLDEPTFTLTANIFITISIAGFVIELNKIINEDRDHSSFIGDIGASVFIGVFLFWGYTILQNAGWLNGWLISIGIFLALVMFYALFRGILGIFTIIFNSDRKLISVEVFVQVGGLVIAFLALFYAS